MKQCILVSPHVNSFAIEYDSSEPEWVMIDGVRVSVDLLRSFVVAPDKDKAIIFERNGDEVRCKRVETHAEACKRIADERASAGFGVPAPRGYKRPKPVCVPRKYASLG